MNFTELVYLTQKVRYVKYCESVYFVHISPISHAGSHMYIYITHAHKFKNINYT